MLHRYKEGSTRMLIISLHGTVIIVWMSEKTVNIKAFPLGMPNQQTIQTNYILVEPPSSTTWIKRATIRFSSSMISSTALTSSASLFHERFLKLMFICHKSWYCTCNLFIICFLNICTVMVGLTYTRRKPTSG
jgi:hypothetical protein